MLLALSQAHRLRANQRDRWRGALGDSRLTFNVKFFFGALVTSTVCFRVGRYMRTFPVSPPSSLCDPLSFNNTDRTPASMKS